MKHKTQFGPKVRLFICNVSHIIFKILCSTYSTQMLDLKEVDLLHVASWHVGVSDDTSFQK